MFNNLKAKIARFASNEEGASAIEYGLIAGLIAAALLIAVTGIGTGVSTYFTAACQAVGGCAGG